LAERTVSWKIGVPGWTSLPGFAIVFQLKIRIVHHPLF